MEIAGERTSVLVEQLRALDVERLDEQAYPLSAGELRAVEHALEVVLGL